MNTPRARCLFLAFLACVIAVAEPVSLLANDGDPVDASRSGSVATTIRVLFGLTLIGGGAGLLALDPQQPAQPRRVSTVELRSAAFDSWPGPTYRHADPWWDHVFLANYMDGVADGLSVALGDGRELYESPLQPHVTRAPSVKYGGLAAIALGTILVVYRGGSGERRAVRVMAQPGLVGLQAGVGF